MDLMRDRPRNFNKLPIAKRWKALIPRKPKKAPCGYGCFISNLRQKEQDRQMENPRQFLIRASQAWRDLSQAEKNDWSGLARVIREEYVRRRNDWKRVRDAMTFPKSIHHFFLIEYWEVRKHDRVRFWDIQHEPRMAWEEMSNGAKNSFKEKYDFLRKSFLAQKNGVMNDGRVFNPDWRRESEELFARQKPVNAVWQRNMEFAIRGAISIVQHLPRPVREPAQRRRRLPEGI